MLLGNGGTRMRITCQVTPQTIAVSSWKSNPWSLGHKFNTVPMSHIHTPDKHLPVNRRVNQKRQSRLILWVDVQIYETRNGQLATAILHRTYTFAKDSFKSIPVTKHFSSTFWQYFHNDHRLLIPFLQIPSLRVTLSSDTDAANTTSS